MATQRELSGGEKRVLSLCKTLEAYLEARRLAVTLQASAHQAEITAKLVKLVKAEYKPSTQNYWLTFTIGEYAKYVAYMCGLVKFKINLDGSVTTHDNIRITHDNSP